VGVAPKTSAEVYLQGFYSTLAAQLTAVLTKAKQTPMNLINAADVIFG